MQVETRTIETKRIDPRIKEALKQVLANLKPKPEISIAEWADKYLYIPQGDAPLPGKYRGSIIPYQKEMLSCVKEEGYNRFTYMLASQTGKTQCMTAIGCYYLHYEPSSVGMYFSNEKHLKEFSKDRLQATIDATPVLAPLVRKNTTKNAGNTQYHKRAKNGAIIKIKNANVGDNFRGPSYKVVLMDEVDALEDDIQGEGDPIQQAQTRCTVFGKRAKFAIFSTPTIKDASLTEREFLKSDQRHYYIDCPKCGFAQILENSSVIDGEIYYHFKIPNGDATACYFECKNPDCRYEIHEREKTKLLHSGRWIKHNPEVTDHAGFTLSTFYSPFMPWVMLAKEWLEAVKNGNEAKKAFINTRLAQTWSDFESHKLNLNTLTLRREDYSRDFPVIPKDVAYLMVGSDVQLNRIEATLLGIGDKDQVYVLKHFVFDGKTDTSRSRAFEDLDNLIRHEFTHESGNKMKVLCSFVDSGYQTIVVNDWCKPRNAMGVYAIKGTSTTLKDFFNVSELKDGNAHINLDSNKVKSVVIPRLAINDSASQGYIHFPKYSITDMLNPDGSDYDNNYFEQLLSEYQFKGRWEKKVKTRPNEALDCLVYAYSAYLYAKTWRGVRVNPSVMLESLNTEKVNEEKDKGNDSNPTKLVADQNSNFQTSYEDPNLVAMSYMNQYL